MKYKVGDKVKIKHFKNFGTIEQFLEKHNHILTIKKTYISKETKENYFMTEETNQWCWTEEYIEKLISEEPVLEKVFITSRFEILDL